MSFLSVENLYFSYGQTQILKNISMTMERGHLASLLGKSGSGKTTLLRLCAGLESSEHGQILLNGQPVNGGPKGGTSIGFVFQDFALFEHLSVQQNLQYGCQKASDYEAVEKMKTLFRIESLTNRMPGELSGGERQRVALARALVIRPQLLLMDEPFASIDRDQTRDFIGELREIFTQLGVTALMVTHSLDEAIQFSDRVLFLEQGEVLQDGTVTDFYRAPATESVRRFFGEALWLKGVRSGDVLKTDCGPVFCGGASGVEEGASVEIFLQSPQRLIFRKGK